MRKTDKKLDNLLRHELTEICDHSLKLIEGFTWLTHIVDYDNFPQSLKIIIVFDTAASLNIFVSSDEKAFFINLIQRSLKRLNIKLKLNNKHVLYDSEEHCFIQSAGNWSVHLSRSKASVRAH